MAFAGALFEECWPRWQQHWAPEVRLRLGGVVLAALAGTDLSLPEVAGGSLSAEELEQWTGFSQEKRRLEWLGGRIAAKWAAAGILAEREVDWRTLVIRTEQDGRPSLSAAGRAGAPFLSISHSGGLAAALAANLPCGLDIQQPNAKIHTVKKRFASPAEEDTLNGSLPGTFPETKRLTMLWAAKEAVRKMVRLSPLLGLAEIRLLAGQGGAATPQEPLLLTFAADRALGGCPGPISGLCFFAENLAWAMACPPIRKE